MTRIYIAGPMTGYPEWNFPAFHQRAAELRALGHHVENPAENGIRDGFEWPDYLRMAIQQLLTCEEIHLLPGWQESEGACLELHIARKLRMQVTEGACVS